MTHAKSALRGNDDKRSVPEAVVNILRQRFSGRVETGAEHCRQHANTVTWLGNEAPDVVVFADALGDVCDLMQIAAEHRVPVIAFGGGTSLEGQVNAPHGGISLDLSRMNRIVAVHEGDLDATVEAGVTRVQLNTYLRDTGLFFQWIRERTLQRWVVWRRREHRAPMPCGMAPFATMSFR